MPVTRINHFEAKERQDSAEALNTFMQGVVRKVQTLPGCRSVRLLRSTENAGHFAIVEEWDSVQAHQAAAKTIAPAELEKARSLVAREPTGEYYQ